MAQSLSSEKLSLEEELEQLGVPPGSYEVEPLSMVRRAVAKRLTEAARDVPHYSLTAHIPMGALAEVRAALNEKLAADGVKASINDLIIKAAALALIDTPEANASFMSRGIIRHKKPDVSFAVAI